MKKNGSIINKINPILRAVASMIHTSLGGKILIFPLICLLTVTGTAFGTPTQEELSRSIARHLVCFPMQLARSADNMPVLTTRDLCLSSIYKGEEIKPLWVTGRGPTENAETILHYLETSGKHGLEPGDYDLDRLRELWSTTDVNELAELETLITYNIIKYVHDISFGRQKPQESDPILFAEAGDKGFSPELAIKSLTSTGDLDRFLAELPPGHSHYIALKAGLEYYRNIAADGGWPSVPQGPSLRPGDIGDRVAAVRRRLHVTDLPQDTSGQSSADEYDPQLEQAVKAFQKRHGLDADGIVGINTLEAMNTSVAERIECIRLNMARWRWQAHHLGIKYVLVNIAAFNLKAYLGEDIALDIPIIVGQEQHQTPVFSDTIKYIDFNPFWNITPSIARNEELPQLRKNKDHLIDRRVRLFSNWSADAVELDSATINWQNVTRKQMSQFKLRQDPGPFNALGKIKFVFPNRYSVYLHDTPSHNLFSRSRRNFSHGCIRVSDVLSLAVFLLQDQPGGWSAGKVKEIYNQTERKVISLPNPVPVHITYQTSWIDKNGVMHFNRDVYGRDAKLRKALF
jgi:murein L,D-transpeptidase YcbB/YkuD